MQHDWTQDTQQDFQDDTQQDFQDDTQQDFQDDIQHDADPNDFAGYPPAKGHHRPDGTKHITPVFHHTTPQPQLPVHTTYQSEPPVQQTTIEPQEPTHHNPHTTPPSEYTTTYHPETTEHTTPADHGHYRTTYYPTERTTYDSYDTTKHPGLLDYESTTYPSPHGKTGSLNDSHFLTSPM